MKKHRWLIAVSLIGLLGASMAGCTAKPESSIQQRSAQEQKIRIALQYGLAYAPVQIMEKNKLIEKYLPGASVTWKQMGTGPVIRDAMVTGEVDIGFMGISPFLIGWDKGAEWKIATAAGSQPLSLVTYKDGMKSVANITAQDKIATPAVASIQHILLSMEAEKHLGNAHALDQQMVSITHPDATTSLLGKKDITAHFSSPPFLFKELADPEVHQVISGEEAFGSEFSFIFGVASNQFHDSNPAAYGAFIAAFNEAIAFINNQPNEAAKILAPLYKMSQKECYKALTAEGTNFCSTPYGIMGFAEFMHEAGYINKLPDNIAQISFENVQAAIGKRYGTPSVTEKIQLRNGVTSDQ